MKLLTRIWDFLISWSEDINKYRKHNARINAWY